MIALFPGQGSQEVGMGKDLFENFSIARETFEEASEAIRVDIKKLCFQGPEDRLQLTENTQPCLLTTSIAAFRCLQKETGFQPKMVAGHSLGEYSALVAAGAIEFSTAVTWVRERGKAMQEAVAPGLGTMAAIMGLENLQVEKLCMAATEEAIRLETDSKLQPTVEPANFNAPGQVVIAGTVGAVQVASEMATSKDYSGKVIPLNVSAPFHCRLMKPARDHLQLVFEKTENSVQDLQCPYIPNRTARITTEKGVILELLMEQMDHPVLWTQTMESVLERGEIERGIEFGSGKVLAGLCKRIARSKKKPFNVAPMGDSPNLKSLEEWT